MRRLIIFLARRRLGLKKGEPFQFNNQKTTANYWFTSDDILREEYGIITKSHVSFNWILDKKCKITKVGK